MVMGNSQYQNTQPLKKSASDAQEIAQRLEAFGWDVSTAIDLPQDGLETSMASFEKSAVKAEQTLLYYSGHAMQVNGENYIVPVEFDPEEADMTTDLVSLNEAVERLSKSPGQVAVFIDASRDNPMTFEFEGISRQNRPEAADWHFDQGLAELSVGSGTFVAFATAPGHVARDSISGNSHFTKAFLKHIHLQNQDVRTLSVRIRDDVMKATGGSQIPWHYSSLTADFWINGIPPKPPEPDDD